MKETVEKHFFIIAHLLILNEKRKTNINNIVKKNDRKKT